MLLNLNLFLLQFEVDKALKIFSWCWYWLPDKFEIDILEISWTGLLGTKSASLYNNQMMFYKKKDISFLSKIWFCSSNRQALLIGGYVCPAHVIISFCPSAPPNIRQLQKQSQICRHETTGIMNFEWKDKVLFDLTQNRTTRLI